MPAGQEVHFRHFEQEISLNYKKAKTGGFPTRVATCKWSCFPLSTKRVRQPCWQCPRSCSTKDGKAAKNQAWGHQTASRKQNAKAWVPFPCQCCWVPNTLLQLRENIPASWVPRALAGAIRQESASTSNDQRSQILA